MWSRTAGVLKRKLTRARLTALLLTIAGAVLATVAGEVASGAPTLGKWLAAAAAIAVGTAPVALRGANTKAVQKWTRARATSEGLKTEIYTYMAGVGPYRGPGRDKELVDRLASVSQQVADLLRYTRPTDSAGGQLPPITDVSTYAVHRVDAQSQWYRDKAKDLGNRQRVLTGLGLALSIAVLVLGAISVKAGVGPATAWVATTATVAAAVAAYAAWARYEYQVVSYLRTADALKWAVARRPHTEASDASSDDDFVAECERIIADENKDWVTEWSRSEPG
jgi:hypothetical protein